MTRLLSNLIFDGALSGLMAFLLWAGVRGVRMRSKERSRVRATFIRDLVKMLEDMIPEGQGDGFDAAKWVARWLETPQPALAGAAPKAYLDTTEGRAIVKRLLGTIESGAYI